MAFVPWIIPASAVPPAFANLEQKAMVFRSKRVLAGTPLAIVAHSTQGIFAQNEAAVLADNTRPALWLQKSKMYFQPLLAPLEGSGCLLLCGRWSDSPEGFLLSHIQLGNDVILDPAIASQMLQNIAPGFSIAPWVSSEITLGGSSSGGFDRNHLARMLATDPQWSPEDREVSLQPSVHGVVSAETFAAYAMDVKVPVIEPTEERAHETKVSRAANSEEEMVEEEEEDDLEDFTEAEITEILAQYLTPDVLESIPVTRQDEAGIHFVQYVCDFVKEDLWQQREMSESRWINVVRRLKKQLYDYLESKPAA